MSNGDPDGLISWMILVIPTALGGIGAFFHLKSDVRAARASVGALEDKVEVQYKAILRELDIIKEMVDK
ncbi:hypothetical protein LCGC14_1615000 [marine sediment metagenome]|uniref:Uncharacterized protein n=2 Tax=marine sediment metagenome TaxID=412755 RepID=A0A0F9I764_9ZZZZ